MKNLFRSSLLSAFLVSTFLAFAAGSAGAQGKGDVSKLEFDKLPSPDINIQGGRNKGFKPKDWLECTADIKIPALNQQQDEAGYLDRVVVKWYLAIKEKASGRPVLLTADINHINVPVDESFLSAVYLSPNTVGRLTGSDTVGSGMVEAIGVEVLVNGVKVAQASEKERAGWWESPNLSRTDKYPLLNKYQTPFKMLWWDRYAEIEETR